MYEISLFSALCVLTHKGADAVCIRSIWSSDRVLDPQLENTCSKVSSECTLFFMVKPNPFGSLFASIVFICEICVLESSIQPLVSLAVWERRHERLLGFGALKVLYETDLIS